jgi:predicted sugar kinase
MELHKQVEIMEKQLSNFDSLIDKMQYLNDFFKKDPEFTQDAINIVVSNMCKDSKAPHKMSGKL